MVVEMLPRRGDPCGRPILKRRRDSLRLTDYDYFRAGAYFVTICCKSRYPVFSTTETREEVLKQMQDLEKRFRIILDCGVVAIDHIHLLLRLLDNLSITLSQIVGAFKSLVYRQMRMGGDKPHPYASLGSFWQRGFYDHIIRDEKDWHEKAKYIENHPIKEELSGLLPGEWVGTSPTPTRPGVVILKWH